MNSKFLNPSGNRLRWAACALLFGCIWLLYARTADFGFTNFDDPVYVLDNPQVRAGLSLEGVSWAFSTATGGYPMPMTWVSHMLDTTLFGLGPAGPHLMNVIIHSVNALLLVYFLFGATGAFWRSFFVAAIFALHPLRVESVAWIAERKDVLSGFFMLATLRFYLRYAQTRKFGFYLGSFLTCLLAVLSKPVAVTLPVVLWLLDIWPLKRIQFEVLQGESRTQTLTRWLRKFGALGLEKIPYLALSAGLSLLTVLALHGREVFVSSGELPFMTRLAGVAPNYLAYLRLIFWPRNLAVFYPHPLGWTAFEILVAVSIMLLISWAAFILAKKGWYVLAVGWGWFLVVTFPITGILQNGSQSVADRFIYFSSIGITIPLVWGIWKILERHRHADRVGMTLGVATAITLSLLTYPLVGTWKDSVTLFTRAAAVTRASAITYTNLAAGYFEKNEYERAIAAAERALAVKEDMLEALNILGMSYTATGESDRAMDIFRRALKTRPYFRAVNNNLADLLLERGDSDQAMTHYFRALQDLPSSPHSYARLGEILAGKGRLPLAEKYVRLAVEVGGSSFSSYKSYWKVLSGQTTWQEAVARFKPVVRAPADRALAHYAAATACSEDGNYAGAKVHLEEALREAPEDLSMRADLAEANIRLGLVGEALSLINRGAGDGVVIHGRRLLEFSLLLSTHQDPMIRAGKDSEELAVRAMQSFSEESAFAWLVLAYAKAGRSDFRGALEVCSKAEEIARTSGRSDLTARISGIAKEYSEGRIVPMEVIAPNM